MGALLHGSTVKLHACWAGPSRLHLKRHECPTKKRCNFPGGAGVRGNTDSALLPLAGTATRCGWSHAGALERRRRRATKTCLLQNPRNLVLVDLSCSGPDADGPFLRGGRGVHACQPSRRVTVADSDTRRGRRFASVFIRSG